MVWQENCFKVPFNEAASLFAQKAGGPFYNVLDNFAKILRLFAPTFFRGSALS